MRNQSWVLLSTVLMLSSCADSLAPQSRAQNQASEAQVSTGVIAGQLVLTAFEKSTSAKSVARSTVSVGNVGYTPFCSGVLISDQLVLTAAHCLYDEDKNNEIQDLSTLELTLCHDMQADGTPCESLGVTAALSHAGFRYFSDKNRGGSEMLANDIAILKLARPFKEGSPLPLLQRSPKASETMLIAGYGKSENEAQYSDGLLRMADLKVATPFQRLPFSLIIAKDKIYLLHNQVTGGCQGDSGGPAFARDEKGNLQVAGVASHTVDTRQNSKKPCASSGIAYTSVDSQKSWLKKGIEFLVAEDTAPGIYLK